jgi:phosphoserine phosphatase
MTKSDLEILKTWNDGRSKQAIIDFLRATDLKGPNYIKPEDRIATFDNDGTLCIEQPVPVWFDFMFKTFLKAAEDDPSLCQIEPYMALIEDDSDYISKLLEQNLDALLSLEKALAHAWGGKTPEEFDDDVYNFISKAEHPEYSLPYTDLIYRPMLELFELLHKYQYRIFVCSGGGRDFMRAIAEDTLGLFKENIIGTAAEYEYRDSKLIRINKILGGISLGPGKVEHIFAATGRFPIFAVGNSDGDTEMLDCARFKLIVNHDDPDREYSYQKGAEKLLENSEEKGYTVLSMKNDWKKIFKHQ